jgi:hypothetical protein
MNKEWFIIKDLKEFVDSSRRLVFQSFGKNTTEEDQNVIDDMLDNINNMSTDDESEMNIVLSYEESLAIINPFLKKQINKKTKENRFLVSESIYMNIVHALNDRMVSNILNSLVNKGLIETAYDDKSNDFVFWISDSQPKNEEPKTN